MKIREHRWAAARCVFCGAPDLPTVQRQASALGKEAPQVEERTCVEREDYGGRLRPEPALREIACEANSIAARIAELAAEREAVRATPATELSPNHEGWCY